MIRLDLPWKPTPRPPKPEVAVARAKRSYSGAQTTRLTADWVTALLSADEALRRNLRKLRERSRDLSQNTPHGAKYLQLLRTHAVGPEGVQPQVRLYSTRGRLNAALNAKIEDAWWEFGRPGVPTDDARLSMVDLQNLYYTTMAMDGEFLAEFVADPAHPHGMYLRLIDADQLDEQYNAPTSPAGGPIVMGVEYDARRRPAFYHLWADHPTEGRRQVRRRVPADLIIHDFMPLRAHQSRGVPWFAPVLVVMRLDEGYLEAEVTAARAGAANPLFYEVDLGGPDLTTDEDGNQLPLEEDLEPLTSRALPPGVKAHLADVKHPTTAFKEFRKAVHMGNAAGLLVSYTSLTGDLEAVNYSSIRAGLLDERDFFRGLHRFQADHFLDRVFERWARFAALAGALDLPVRPAEVMRATRWQGRGWSWVDPLNDIQTAEREIRLGLNSRRRLAAARGLNYEDLVVENQEDLALAAELGVDVSGTDGPSQAPAPEEDVAPPATEDSADDTDEAANDRARHLRRVG